MLQVTLGYSGVKVVDTVDCFYSVTTIQLVERNANESSVNVHILQNVNRNLNVKHLKVSSRSSIRKLSHPFLSFDLYDLKYIS